ncbi:LysM peptidoglycan-binding domain-containing protein [Pedobacter suwonensis]|uniref:LysM peptidoglycan-binding domain-containing protein n=1 Tax=Pedobacter suwonensis TaxID=332999 RepID=UPI0011A5CF84|nr:LysM domain-containing protein [Pedobacter suwonensis]
MVYTVSAGYTLSKIALKFNVPLSTILNLNQIQRPDQLFINQIIQIPNVQEIPEDASFSLPTPASMLINRAKSVINS